MQEFVRNFVSLWRKEADGVLEVRELTLYEQSVWESVNLMSSVKDDDQYSSGMVMKLSERNHLVNGSRIGFRNC